MVSVIKFQLKINVVVGGDKYPGIMDELSNIIGTKIVFNCPWNNFSDFLAFFVPKNCPGINSLSMHELINNKIVAQCHLKFKPQKFKLETPEPVDERCIKYAWDPFSNCVITVEET